MVPNIYFFIMLNIVLCSGKFQVPVLDTLNFPQNFKTENKECNKHVQLFTESFNNNTLWAYRMWDSSARVPLGLTEGSQYHLGHFDECLSIKEPFIAQYCLATIYIEIQINRTIQDPYDIQDKPYVNLYEKIDKSENKVLVPRNQIFWALCVPSSCSAYDIQTQLQKHLNTHQNRYIKQYTVEIGNKDCQIHQNEYQLSALDIAFCSVVGFFTLIVIISTVYHINYYNVVHEKNKSTELFLCFSAKQNFLDLQKSEESNVRLDILYGTKFYITFITVLVHNLINTFAGSVFNFHTFEKINRTPVMLPFIKADLSIDIFFLIGGLLNTYLFLKQTEKKKYNAVRAVILRYFRYVPIFTMVTFFYITLFDKISSGPLWSKLIGSEKEYCEKNWWTNILLLNNYINIENMCIIQGWYLVIDFQVFIYSIPLNYLIRKNNKYSWTILITVIFLSILVPFLIIHIGKKEPFFCIINNFVLTVRNDNHFQTVYVPSHTRMTVYIIGMLLGFIYYKLRESKLKISLVPSTILIVTGTSICSASLFFALIFLNPYHQYNPLFTPLYGSLHRPIFALGVALILFTLSFGSIPTKFLTWKPLVPLSKLMFGVYLIHFIIQLIKTASKRSPVNVSVYYLFSESIMDTAVCLMVSFVLYIIIESPCNKFIKEITQFYKSNKIE